MFLFYFIIVIVVFILDQTTKLFATKIPDTGIFIFNFSGISLSFENFFNSGISFGFLSSQKLFVWLFLLGSLITLIFLTFNSKKPLLELVFWAIIMGGAIGNIFDRLLKNGVQDFIKIATNYFTFPVFNFADIAIVTGTTVLLLLYKNKKTL